MEVLKLAVDWAKAEVFSTAFFVLFWMVFIWASGGFLLLGQTEMAKAYIWPTLIAGSLLLLIGVGLFGANQYRVTNFEKSYNTDASAFVESEVVRVDKTLDEYKNIVFTAIPVIIALCALLIIFMDTPIWRASLITSIAMLTIILLVDGNAHSRMEVYNEQLKWVDTQK